MLGLALGQLAALFGGVDVADEAVLVAVAGDRLQPVRRHRADAVGGQPHAHTLNAGGPLPQGVDALKERLHGRVAEPHLARAGGWPGPPR